MKWLVRRTRGEEGVALIIAVVLMGVVATLGVLMLTVGVHTDQASARGRNWVQALHVAESGVDQAMAKIQNAAGNYSGTFTGATAQGSFSVTVSRQTRNQYTINSVGSVAAGKQGGATRALQVTMAPPSVFKNALFSYTTLETKNNDAITGDVWANQNAIVDAGTTVTGSVTAATGYIEIDNGSSIGGNAWSGSFNNANGYAIYVQQNATVDGWAKGSVTNPPDPITCGGANSANYKVRADNGASIGGDVTTWGSFTGSGTAGGTVYSNTCTAAPAAITMPVFTYSASNYDASTLHQFGTPTTSSATAVSDFQSYLSSHSNQLAGTFYINQSSPVNQNTWVDLTNAVVTGDLTIITNTPIFTNGTTDQTTNAVAVLISTYKPPTGTSCDLNQDKSECAIHLKNNFAVSGNTAVLVYAPYGPVAVKNNAIQYGAIYSDSIQIKNNQSLTYDSRIERTVGFGDSTLEVTRWLEVKP
jgi:Tfp pilus assembly protein PilX